MDKRNSKHSPATVNHRVYIRTRHENPKNCAAKHEPTTAISMNLNSRTKQQQQQLKSNPKTKTKTVSKKKPIWNSRFNQPVEPKSFPKPETNWREIHQQSILKMRRDRLIYSMKKKVFTQIRKENVFAQDHIKLKELKMNTIRMNNTKLDNRERYNRPKNCAWFVPL